MEDVLKNIENMSVQMVQRQVDIKKKFNNTKKDTKKYTLEQVVSFVVDGSAGETQKMAGEKAKTRGRDLSTAIINPSPTKFPAIKEVEELERMLAQKRVLSRKW